MDYKHLTQTALATALLVVASYLIIPIGTIPVTLQTVIVLMIGLNLKPQVAVSATSLYVLMGLIGIPVFSGGRTEGLASFMIPSFGFTLGFIAASTVMSLYLERVGRSTQSQIIATFIGTGMIYLFGSFYFYGLSLLTFETPMTYPQVLMATVIPFILFDTVKAGLAYYISTKMRI